ncbi:OsmC family protein [Aeromicrobium choanae]|uniref:Uncharacterized OsmC-related protein n=1 Tax=Aeromicrobium choanae TaxID=1736691 RepID=A0A1T4YW27_9ACTN|nr:hypothetical protein [Aeromicrobium choanae]SKB05926.1 Uncharacterized OsmC-related protein [Aeromicrobium choanae]
MSGYDYISAVTGCTTEIPGRFTISGPSFQLLADGSVATGGPGRAPGPLDLLVSALVTNLLNVLHGAEELDVDEADVRTVHVRARTSRYTPDRLKVGRVEIEVVIDELDPAAAEILLEQYRRGCRVLPAVETVLDVRMRAVAAADAAA